MLDLFYFYWPLIIMISISKPISDYIWVKEEFPFKKTVRRIFYEKNQIILTSSGLIFLVVTHLIKDVSFNIPFVIVQFLFSLIFIFINIRTIRSILICGLVALTYSNFTIITYLIPLTKINDLPTLSNLLSNLINIFNYFGIALAVAALIWKFGASNESLFTTKMATVSTIFYTIIYIMINMLIGLFYVLIPILNRIRELAT